MCGVSTAFGGLLLFGGFGFSRAFVSINPGFCGFCWWKLRSFLFIAGLKFSVGSHEFSSLSYPNHLTRYSIFRPLLQLSRILSTSYSSLLSSKCYSVLIAASLGAGSSSETWNTQCIHAFFGSLSQ